MPDQAPEYEAISYRSTIKLSELVGKTVTEIRVDPTSNENDWGPGGNESLYLVCGGETFQLRTEGGCCSESWWADIYSPQQIIGGTITQAIEIAMPLPNDDRSRQEVDEAYGIRIRTEKGESKFVFRNSSNGYYGGGYSISKVDAAPDTTENVTEDWSA